MHAPQTRAFLPAALRRLAACLFLFSLILPVAAQKQSAADKAREAWMAGYLKLEEGEKAEAGGNKVLALEMYQGALAVFRLVEEKYPDWNQALLSYRIKFCEERIRRLEASVEAGRNTMTKDELLATVEKLTVQNKKLTLGVSLLKKQLDLTTASLERARTEAAASASGREALEALTMEKAALEKRLAAAAEREKFLEAEVVQLKTAAGLAAEAARLQDEIKLLQARSREQQQLLDEQGRERQKLRDSLQAVTIERERLLQESETLRRLSDGQAAELRTLNGRLEEADRLFRQQSAQLEVAAASQRRAEERLAEHQARAGALETQVRELRGSSQEAEMLRRELEAAKAVATAAAPAAAPPAAVAELEQARVQLRAKDEELLKLVKDREAVVDDLERAVADLRAARADLAVQTAEAQRQKQMLDALQAARQQQVDQMEATRERIRRQQEDLEARNRQLADLREQQKAREGEVQNWQNRANDLAAVNKRQEAQIAALEAKIPPPGQAEGLAAEIAGLKSRQAILEADLLTLRKSAEEKDGRIAIQNEMLAQLSAKNPALEAMGAAAAEQAAVLQKQLEAAQQQLDLERQRISALDNELRGARAALAESAKAPAPVAPPPQPTPAASAEIQAVTVQLEAARQQLELERRRVSALDNELRGARTALAESAKAPAPVAPPPQAAPSATAELQALAAQLEAARQQLELERRRVSALDNELRGARAALAESAKAPAPVAPPPQPAPAASAELQALAAQLEAAQKQLEQERQRGRALEQALVTAELVKPQAPAATAPIPAATLTAPVPGLPGTDAAAKERARLVLDYLRQAVAAESRKAVEAALWNYGKAVELEPKNALALKRLGLIHLGQGNRDKAVEFLRRAFYETPDDLDVLLPLGDALLRSDLIDLGLSMLSRAAALRPDDPGVHRHLAVACSSLGWNEAAESQFRRALRLKADDAEAAFNLAVLLATREPPRLAEAAELYRKAVSLGAEPDPGLDRMFKKER